MPTPALLSALAKAARAVAQRELFPRAAPAARSVAPYEVVGGVKIPALSVTRGGEALFTRGPAPTVPVAAPRLGRGPTQLHIPGSPRGTHHPRTARQLERNEPPTPRRTYSEDREMREALGEIVDPALVPVVEDVIKRVVGQTRSRWRRDVKGGRRTATRPRAKGLSLEDLDTTVPEEGLVTPEDLRQAAFRLLLDREVKGQIPRDAAAADRFLYSRLRGAVEEPVRKIIKPTTLPGKAERVIFRLKKEEAAAQAMKGRGLDYETRVSPVAIFRKLAQDPRYQKLRKRGEGSVGELGTPEGVARVLDAGQPTGVRATNPRGWEDLVDEARPVSGTHTAPIGDPFSPSSTTKSFAPGDDPLAALLRKAAPGGTREEAKMDFLRAAMGRLDFKQQEVFERYYGVNSNPRSIEDIAKELGVTRQAVEKRLKNAHEKLRVVYARPRDEKYRKTATRPMNSVEAQVLARLGVRGADDVALPPLPAAPPPELARAVERLTRPRLGVRRGPAPTPDPVSYPKGSRYKRESVVPREKDKPLYASGTETPRGRALRENPAFLRAIQDYQDAMRRLHERFITQEIP